MYCMKWELEDMKRTTMEITIAALRESVRAVMSYLRLTFKSGEDYADGWLPTLGYSCNTLVTPPPIFSHIIFLPSSIYLM